MNHDFRNHLRRTARALLMLLASARLCIGAGQLRVVASIPDLGDMARRIGGARIALSVLATGKEDLHAVPARPSFLPLLNRADLLLTLGLDAEHSWLPALVAEARNPRIREGGPWWVDCSEGITVLGIPQRLDRSEGEQHPRGNPHYNIGPQCGPAMIRTIAEAFAAADPDNAKHYRENAILFTAEVDALILELRERGAGLKNVAVVEYHPDVAYLCDFYGMRIIGSIEPKAGVPPTAGHLRRLTDTAKREGIGLVVHNQSQNPRVAGSFASQAGCPVVMIANAVGAAKGVDTWTGLQRYNLERILGALTGAAR